MAASECAAGTEVDDLAVVEVADFVVVVDDDDEDDDDDEFDFPLGDAAGVD
ncbi:MAG: hypothetical protein JO057_17470 [Chloroflexi bacterium]|nr:hypothetical protein [Chloroflexota bacterium]